MDDKRKPLLQRLDNQITNDLAFLRRQTETLRILFGSNKRKSSPDDSSGSRTPELDGGADEHKTKRQSLQTNLTTANTTAVTEPSTPGVTNTR